MGLLRTLSIFGLLFLLCAGITRCQQAGQKPEDELEDEDTHVESEGEKVDAQEDTEEEDSIATKTSPFADVASHIVQLDGGALPANEIISVLVGFTNTGKSDFTVDVIEGSFRYPQDYNYHIQNFTYFRYNRRVAPGEEISLLYRFFIHESYHSRSLGLAVNVHYHSAEDKMFQSAAFNETVRISEPLEGFDAETFFLYVFLVAVIVLVAFGGYHVFRSYGKKFTASSSSKQGSSGPAIEIGTQKGSDVDTEWLPAELVASLRKQQPGKPSGSPTKAPKASPTDNGSPRSEPNNDSNDARQRKVRPGGTKMAD